MDKEDYSEKCARKLFYKRLSGSKQNKEKTMRLAVRMARLIAKRFDKTPGQWQCKHIKWFIEVHVEPLHLNTQQNYRTQLRKILRCIDKQCWESFLLN